MSKQFVDDYVKFVREHGYMSKVERDAHRVKQSAEVFTPTTIVQEILSWYPDQAFDENQEFIDKACGDGQFLVEVVVKKLEMGKYSFEEILQQTYGIDIMPDNVEACRKRLAGPKPSDAVKTILSRNIVCANALDAKHVGWKDIGYMWDDSKVKHKKEVESFFV